MKNAVQTPRCSNSANSANAKRHSRLAIIFALAALLSVSAHAQLAHRYAFDSTNDTVGTANGTLVNGATLSAGALVTEGGNGATNGTWTGTGQRMTLDPSAVAGITNAFSLETWFTCTTGWPKYDSLYAFSDGTAGNYLLGVPVNGYSPWPSGVNIAGGGGSNNAAVFGIYLDTAGTHQAVLTYDGTNFSWYVDGLLANFSGMAATATDPGFNLSTLTDIGINGGSPFNDPTLTGSTYDFRIYRQALSPAQVSAIYALGSDALNSDISAALLPPTAFTWNGGGTNDNWSTGPNWVGGAAPALSGTKVTFAGSTRTSPNLDVNYSVDGLFFSASAGSFSLGSANGSALTLAGDLLNYSTNVQTLTIPVTLTVGSAFTTPTNLTLGGALSGSGGITKNGDGVLTLSAANTFAGATTISAGTVKLGDANALQSSTVAANVLNGLTFNTGIGTFNLGALSGTAGLTLADTGSAPVTLSVGGNNSGTAFGGVLAGAGSLAKMGSGTMTLNDANTYTGGTTVSGGTLAARNAGAPGAVTPFGTGPVTVNSAGVLELGFAPTNGFFSFTIPNNVTLDNGSLYVWDSSQRVTGTLTIGAGSAAMGSTFNAPWEVFAEVNFPKALFIDGMVSGTGNLTVQQTGWQVGNAWNCSCAVFTSQGTAAQNTYSGKVTVNPLAAPNGGSYLYLVGTNVMANATINLTGDNSPTSGRMGVSTLLFGNGRVDGPGYITIGGLEGVGSLLLNDTILFQGSSGYSNGIPVALTVGYNNASTIYSGEMSGAGSLVKVGSGTLTLSGVNTYTGDTTVNGGSLVLGGGWLNSANVTVAAGATLDVSALVSPTLAGTQALLNGGTVNGSIGTSSGSKIYAGTAGGYGTNAITGNLALAAGALVYLDLGASASGPNDRVTVGGALTANTNIIHLKAPSTTANLDINADYVLFTSVSPITGSFAAAPIWDVAPANAGHYAIETGPNTVTLHYFANYNGPSAAGSATPWPAVRNQNVLITVTATNGNPGTVNGVVVDASQIGGSAALALTAAGGNVWTASVAVTPDTPAGSKTLVATVSDTASFAATITIPLAVAVGNDVWNGAGTDDYFSSNLNWANSTAPGYIGDSLEFAGSARPTPNVDHNYTFTGIAFDSGAGPFNISSGNGSGLTLTANGVVNNSASSQTLNVPITMSAPQTFNAAAGSLVLAQGLTKGGNLVTVTGAANTVISGPVSDSGSLFKKGSGALIIGASSSWDLAQASSGGLSGPFIAQAGTVTFNNASTHTVTGELVVGGVITNGNTGNNARLVVDNATLNVSTWLSLGRGNGVGTVSSDLVLTNGGALTAANLSAGYNANSSLNKPKGSITMSDTSSLTISGTSQNLYVGESSGSDMTMNVHGNATVSAPGAFLGVGLNSGKGVLNVNGGSVSVNWMRLGAGANSSSTAQGTLTVNSGTLNSEGDVELGFAGSRTAGQFSKFVINNGTVNIATTTKRWLIMSRWDTATSEFDVNGGKLNINANTDIRFAVSGNTGINVFNLNGGAVTFYSDNATTVGGAGVVDLHQGSGSTVNNTFNLNGGTLSVAGVLSANNSGTRTFNFNGGTLKAVTNNASFLSLGTGSAAAYVRSGGAVIDNNGFSVTIPQALLNNGVEADGGLTANGAGTLILSGANTYAGPTKVNAGTLALSQPSLAAVSTVAIASGAVLRLDFATTNRVSALVLDGVSQAPGVYDSTTGAPYITGTGSLLVQAVPANPTSLTVSVSGSTMTLSWPADYLGWLLQVQTNSLSTGLGTNWVDVPGSASITSTNLTANPAIPAEFFRLRRP